MEKRVGFLLEEKPRHKENKRFFLLSKDKIPNFTSKKKYLFENPRTFLTLPNECNFKFIVNKSPIGPKYDKEDKLIPYSFIGDIKHLSHKNIFNSSMSNKSRISAYYKLKDNYNAHNNYLNSREVDEISEKEIRQLFQKFKEEINYNEQMEEKGKNKKENEKKENNIKKIIIMDELKLQENSLKKNKFHLNQIEKIQNKIQKKINLYIKRKHFNYSRSKYLSANLIMNSVNNYFCKKEAKKIFLANKNNEEGKLNKTLSKARSYNCKKTESTKFDNPNIGWEMSLRKPKNFKGIRKKILNAQTSRSPYWFIFIEKNDINKEYISDSRYKTENNFYKKNKIASNDIKYFKDINTLNVKGEKLIDFEEKLCKRIKGKKKIYKFKYDEKNLKNLDIYSNFIFRGQSISSKNK